MNPQFPDFFTALPRDAFSESFLGRREVLWAYHFDHGGLW